MKAVICTKYGPPEGLEIKEIDIPVPNDDEVLIKVCAVAVNDYDWSLVRGKPYAYRLLFGLWKPKLQIPGIEFSGTIETLGKNVTSFKKGDAVYGDISAYGWGCFAEYICVRKDALVQKPSGMTFVEAASVSHASMLAVQGLIDVGGIQKGQRILINGAGGGMGTFGVQIAKLYDAEVTGVDTGRKLEMMKSIGYDHIIDYKKEDFTRNGQRYDLILDAKTNRSASAYARSLKPEGVYVTVGGNTMRLLQLFLRQKIGRKNMRIVSLKHNKDVAYINELFEAGKIKIVTDGHYTLSEVSEAIRYFGEGKHQGKVVIRMDK